jgi:hypothetical protein
MTKKLRNLLMREIYYGRKLNNLSTSSHSLGDTRLLYKDHQSGRSREHNESLQRQMQKLNETKERLERKIAMAEVKLNRYQQKVTKQEEKVGSAKGRINDAERAQHAAQLMPIDNNISCSAHRAEADARRESASTQLDNAIDAYNGALQILINMQQECQNQSNNVWWQKTQLESVRCWLQRLESQHEGTSQRPGGSYAQHV